MDRKLRALKRLSIVDPEMKDRYIATLERAIGGVVPADPKSRERGYGPFFFHIGDKKIYINELRLTDPYAGIIVGHATYGDSGPQGNPSWADNKISSQKALAEWRNRLPVAAKDSAGRGTLLVDPIYEGDKGKIAPLYGRMRLLAELEHHETEGYPFTYDVLIIAFFPTTIELEYPLPALIERTLKGREWDNLVMKVHCD